jgi:hypothetical protein
MKTTMMMLKSFLTSCLFFSVSLQAQVAVYPKGYFRNPLNIPMQLVANFGELRTNHWHMGLDIRTQQKENLPVYAAAEGYISRIKIEPFGFGRAIYINHPNGLTTLYAHLNNFAPAIEQWVKEQQYQQQSWEVELTPPPSLFRVAKSDFIAYSGNTGGSQGPHVHFEIRETSTDKCLNPLLFGFPIADAVPPALVRLGMYDRNRSVYVQSPQLIGLRKAGTGRYNLAKSNTIKVGTDKISFALGAVDYFTSSTNPNGIYSARILVDDVLQSEFILDSISYDDTRYMNAHIDYRYEALVGPYLQHLSRMPGDVTNIYTPTPTEGIVQLTDTALHTVRIEVCDAAQNLSTLNFAVQYEPSLAKTATAIGEKWYPQQINVFEATDFEVFSTESTLYDTVNVAYNANTAVYAAAAANVSLSPLHTFLHSSIPSHDSVTVRIMINTPLSGEAMDRIVIKNVSGSRTYVAKALPQRDNWVAAKFRQFGTFQAFLDTIPPTLNAPQADLSRAMRLVFIPKDNFNEIKSFRAELDGQWLRFTNDKGKVWIYQFDEKFPSGVHELKVTVEDEAGNATTQSWQVTR